jgi:D-alanine--poly(phosphoribitol) ligase subunit 1
VFFTSGTTGRPKAVLSPHRATQRLFTGDTFADFGPGQVMAQTAPAPWDAFAMEVWGMLTTGGTCVLPEDDRLLPDDLRDLVTEAGVNQLWLTSSLFNLFVDEDIDSFVGVRRVITGGERLSVDHVRRFLTRHPDIALVNGYGPVESCVFATTHAVTLADCQLPDGIPIGRPVPGTEVYVLHGDVPAEQGRTGEICVVGDGLALRYLDEDAPASFVTMTLADHPVLVYRTGDLGRFDEHGVLRFAGRADRQVKVAGHRIEPADIESVVRALPGVRDCAVLPVPGPDGDYERLAMFYTADPTAQDPTALRQLLTAALPAYQVPGMIRNLAELPRTSNGKLDRRVLLAMTDPTPVT